MFTTVFNFIHLLHVRRVPVYCKTMRKELKGVNVKPDLAEVLTSPSKVQLTFQDYKPRHPNRNICSTSIYMRKR